MWVDQRITLKQYINSRNYRKYAENMTRCKQIRNIKGLDSSDQDLYTAKKQKQMEKQLSDRLFQVKVFVRQYIIQDDKFVCFEKMIDRFLETLHMKLQQRKKDQILLHNVLEKQIERSQILQIELQKSQIGASLMHQRSFRDFDEISKKSKSNSQSENAQFLQGINKAMGRIQNPQDKFQVVSSASHQVNQNFQQAYAYEIKLNTVSPPQKKYNKPKQAAEVSKRKGSADSQLLHIPDMKNMQQKYVISPIQSATSRQQNSVRNRNTTVSYMQKTKDSMKQPQKNQIDGRLSVNLQKKNQTMQNKPKMHQSMAPSSQSKFSKRHADPLANRRIKRKQTLAKMRNDWNIQNEDQDEQWKNRNKLFDNPMAVMQFFGI